MENQSVMEYTGQQINQKKVEKLQKKTIKKAWQDLILILQSLMTDVDRVKEQPIEEMQLTGEKQKALNSVGKIIYLI